MKKIIKNITFLILILSLSLVLLDNIEIIKADSGWDTSYDSGGSWDSGSDWGSSSWDSDYDYDYDYGDNNYSSLGSHSSSSADSQEVFFALAFAIIFMFFPIVIINAFFKSLKSTKKQIAKHINTIDNSKYKELTQEQVSKIIPNLNVTEFNFKAYQAFYDVQMAWMNFEYDKLKELITDELYNSYVMQLELLKSKNHKNTMKQFELIESHIFELKEENGLYIAKVYLNVRFLDYIENTNTGIIVRGSVNDKVYNTYILTFICSKEKSNNVNYCPRCGAKVEGNVTGTCDYCKSKLINKTYNWVMSKKEKIDQR